jgi:hypothetical protein
MSLSFDTMLSWDFSHLGFPQTHVKFRALQVWQASGFLPPHFTLFAWHPTQA